MVVLESVNEEKEEILQKCKQHTCIHCMYYSCYCTLLCVCIDIIYCLLFYYNHCYPFSDLVKKTKEVLNQNIDNNYWSVVFLQ